MAHKAKGPTTVTAVGRAKGRSTGIPIPKKQAADNASDNRARNPATNSPTITSVRRGPGGTVGGLKAEWLVTIEGICVDAPMRDRSLWRYRRFCNVMAHRYGVSFDPMLESDWAAMVEAAIAAEGGAS
jgi:hypothetical protein